MRDIATENKIILIFDECTSGFRETFGGLHKKYGVEPDIAIFAKALGNGYAISACIGRQEFMQAAQQTFISSTFWTERIGPTAALKTLEIISDDKLEFGHPCSITHKFLVLETDLNIVVSSIGLIVLKSTISHEILFIFSSFEATCNALTTDGPNPIIVKSLPLFLIKDFVGLRK